MITQPDNRIRAKRGFTLLIAIILSSVALMVGLALADIAYKQVVLSSTARSSQIAFYRADSAMECALYFDQQFAAFNIGSTFNLNTITCESRAVQPLTAGHFQDPLTGGGTKTTFQIMCANGQPAATVTIYKEGTGTCNGLTAKNCLFTSGYNTCSATDPNRFERGLKVIY